MRRASLAETWRWNRVGFYVLSFDTVIAGYFAGDCGDAIAWIVIYIARIRGSESCPSAQLISGTQALGRNRQILQLRQLVNECDNGEAQVRRSLAEDPNSPSQLGTRWKCLVWGRPITTLNRR
jgi:hypothetical protein